MDMVENLESVQMVSWQKLTSIGSRSIIERPGTAGESEVVDWQSLLRLLLRVFGGIVKRAMDSKMKGGVSE